MRNELTIDCRSQLSELQRIASAVEEICERHAVPSDISFKVNLAIDELFTNAVSYGHCDDALHEIRLSVHVDGNLVTVEMQDNAQAYDPFSEAPPPALDTDLAHKPQGGLGVHLVKTLMDTVAYRREGDRNIITLSKSF